MMVVATIFTNWLESFSNKPGGYSARKLSAFVAVAISVYLTVKYCTSTNLVEVLSLWLLFAMLCMGIITAEQYFIKNKTTPTHANGTN